jgi:hypothetical protein
MASCPIIHHWFYTANARAPSSPALMWSRMDNFISDKRTHTRLRILPRARLRVHRIDFIVHHVDAAVFALLAAEFLPPRAPRFLGVLLGIATPVEI